MANEKHGVIRTDRMYGTDVAANLVTVCYMGTGATATDIDNGNVVKLDGLMAGEREAFKAVTPAKDTPIEQIAVIANPEVMYDERKKNLDEYFNESGKKTRAYILHTNDIFSVTEDALNIGNGVTPAVGYVVELMAGTKLNVVATATSGATTIGKLVEIEKVGRYTYYVIMVA